MLDKPAHFCWASWVLLRFPALCCFLSSLQPGCSDVWAEPSSPIPAKGFPIPLVEWKLTGTGAMASRAGMDSCLSQEGGNGAHLAQQPTAASSFAGCMFVFKFLRPSSLPPLSPPAPGLPLLPSSPRLTRLVCRVGHQAKPLSPAAHQPSAD